jgi:hypothetical protein
MSRAQPTVRLLAVGVLLARPEFGGLDRLALREH